ncbi:hypothetical protein SAMN05421830_10543 [Desulfomicrobium norvegicum]|uniref:Uncharacterized protein n=1 Tax=Desulfomicrobium norvegicum (strain DSM 1741 / NCIMB 8310) TaxID=52561 RepID=A0A8G2C2N3_DESNO|nr:hypothetical protein [Desulfomicrobium norvegicum]SFL70022.1 hypothetical protein SAMN05421830_10543 [Desulfomicrobium norvegicum]
MSKERAKIDYRDKAEKLSFGNISRSYRTLFPNGREFNPADCLSSRGIQRGILAYTHHPGHASSPRRRGSIFDVGQEAEHALVIPAQPGIHLTEVVIVDCRLTERHPREGGDPSPELQGSSVQGMDSRLRGNDVLELRVSELRAVCVAD